MNQPCSNTAAITRHDHDQAARDRAHELAVADTWREFFAGDHRDKLADLATAEPHDWINVALLQLYPDEAQPCACSVRDLYATIEEHITNTALRRSGDL